MARLARVVVPDHPHHVTQRGVRSTNIFRNDTDRKAYVSLIRESCQIHGVDVLVWCLMSNHVHFVVVPKHEQSLAKAFGEAHKRYTREHNLREGVRGYLFQGRFGSCVMDETYLLCAARYVELNPVRKRMVKTAEKWAWSSARFHVGLRKQDPLVTDRSLLGLVDNWRNFLGQGVGDNDVRGLQTHSSSGRPLGSESFVRKLENLTGRVLFPQKRGWIKGKPRKRKS